MIVTGDLSLAFAEDDSQRFNVCVLVVALPEDGLSCDQVVVLMTENGTAGL